MREERSEIEDLAGGEIHGEEVARQVHGFAQVHEAGDSRQIIEVVVSCVKQEHQTIAY